MSSPFPPLQSWKRQLPELVTRIGWILLASGIVLCVGAYLIDPRRSAFNNVVLYLFLASVAGGSIFLVALEYVAGAVWSVPLRRVNEFLSALTPVVPLLAIPVLFNMHDVFHWTLPGAVASDQLLIEKQPYLNIPFFVVRFVIVFLLWGLFALLFIHNSVKQDLSKDQNLTKRNTLLGAIFMPLFAVSLTVLAIDWAMSIEPHWYSTIFGVYFFSGTVLAGLATATLIIVLLHEGGYLPPLRRDHLYSLGALLFAFVNFWAYIAFSQFLLIWYANLPEETFWFLKRWTHGWQYVSVLLIIMQFAVPYFALLAQDAKMNPKRLKLMAIWILVAHFLDVYWLVMPSFDGGVPFSWIEIGYPVLGVGLVIVVLALRMKKYNLVPVGDPKLERGLSFHL
jgi:hypothetical protein